MQFMVNANRPPASLKVRCRQIADGDLDGLADLYTRGFGGRRTRAFWRRVLTCLQTRAVPPDTPRYGYVLDNEGTPVGAILLIFSTDADGAIRANVSSWYVDEAFRGYAQLLVSQALKLKTVTYLNVSAARHTWPILPAQGYQRYSGGLFVALPALARTREPGARLITADHPPDAPFAPFEQALLARSRSSSGRASSKAASRARNSSIAATSPMSCALPRRSGVSSCGAACRSSFSTRTVRSPASSAATSTRPCRNISAALCARASAISPIPRPRCSACECAAGARSPDPHPRPAF
jgi:hypothetical protein